MTILLWLTLSGCIDDELYQERRDELIEEEEEEEAQEQSGDTAASELDTGSLPPSPP